MNKTTAVESDTGFDYQKSLKNNAHPLIMKIIRVNRYINRPLAGVFVKWIFNTRITPNQVTVFSFFVGIAGALMFCRIDPLAVALGGLLAQTASVLDCADGMLARSKGVSSRYGAFLDLFLDRLIDFAFISAITYHLFLLRGYDRVFFMGMLALALYFLQVSLYGIIKGYRNVSATGDTSELRGLFVFAIFVFALINRLDLFIYFLFAERVLAVLYSIYDFLLAERRRDSD